MPTVRLTIDGMMCEGCASRVQESLQQASGVQRADVDLEDATAEVEVRAGDSNADEIRDSVEELGYDVTAMNPS